MFKKGLSNAGYRRTALIFCILGFLFNFYSCFPGFASPDTIDQYQQSLSGVYNDWHPPVMAMLWHYLNYLHKGPALMLAFQLTLLWISAYLLLIHYKNKWWCLAVVMFVFAPYVQNFSGYIIKDSQMGLALLLASILLLRIGTNNTIKPILVIICILSLTYGAIVRPNAFPAAVPFCFLLAEVLLSHIKQYQRLLFGFAILLFILSCNQLQYHIVREDDKQYPVAKLFMYDLTGIYKATGENVYPGFLYSYAGFDTAYLRRRYVPASFDDIWWNTDRVNVIPETDETTQKILRNYWWAAVKRHPGIYLANHWDGYLYYLRLKQRNINFHYYFPYASVQLPDYNKHRAYDGELPFELISFQSFMPYFTPWFWFLLSFLLLLFTPFLQKGFYKQYYISLCLSSLFYQLPVFFIYQTDTDFRYFYWNCICCSLAIIILLFFRKQKPGSNSKYNVATY